MRTAFPEAAVFGFEELMPRPQCDPKDRHVLAAAISGGTDTLATNNVKHFPAAACEPHDLQVRDADAFLMRLLVSDGPLCRRAIEHEARRARRPPLSVRQLLAGLAKVAPTFTRTAFNIWDD